jgi:sRNA-binding protein
MVFCNYGCFRVYLGLVLGLVQVQEAKKQRSKENQKAKKQNSGDAEKRRSKETEKQGKAEKQKAEKQKSKEAKKHKTEKTAQNRKIIPPKNSHPQNNIGNPIINLRLNGRDDL